MNVSKDQHLTDLARRLAEAEATIEALVSGQIDAVVDAKNKTPVLLAKAQYALRESEERYRRIIETTSEGVWLIDAENKTTFMNHRMAKMLGCEADLGLGRSPFEFLDEAGRDALAASADRPEAHQIKVRCSRSDGTSVWALLGVTPVFDSNGRHDGLLAMVMDITDRVRVTEALEELSLRTERRERMLTTTLSSLTDFAYIYDRQGRFLFANQSLLNLLGITLEELIGKNFFDLGYPDDLAAKLQRQIQEVFETKKGVTDETLYKSPAGSDGSYEYIFSPAFGADGTVEFVVGTTRDITERKRAAEAWRTAKDIEEYKRSAAAILSMNEDLERRVVERTFELEQTNTDLVKTRSHLVSILNAATELSIIATDSDGIIQLFSAGASRMLQYQAAEVVGVCTPEKFLNEESWSENFAAVPSWTDRCGLRERESGFVRKDGTLIDIGLTITDLRNPEGERTGNLWVAADFTARKSLGRKLRLNNLQLEKQTQAAESANSAKSDFLASMSHEIRTPMNSILGMADLLWDTNLSEEQRKYVEEFRRAGSNLLMLINDILDLSRIESGQMDLECIEFDLEELADEVMELITPRARSKKIVLLSRLAPGLSMGRRGDPAKLRQVVINLVGNAVKFTDSGRVTLSLTEAKNEDPGGVEIEISDTGIGIAEEKLELIFNSFAQADSSVTRRFGGTGLGLAISKRLVEQMGGQLTVTSKLGEGSVFRLTVPLEAVNREAGNRVDLFGKRALVVDGYSWNRVMLRETLNMWGIDSDEFETASGVLAALPAKSYDICLLDRQLPGMDGFELAAKLAETAPRMPVIMISSDDNTDDTARRKDSRLAGFAVKPIRRPALLRMLLAAMGEKSTEQAQTPATDELPAPLASAAAAMRILVAEDSSDNQFVVKVYLKDTSHTLTFVENGKEAVAAFGNGGQFELILMDIQMPQMDGLSATRMIRAAEQGLGLDAVPIIALTANARAEDNRISLEAGCTAHISKPISKARLLATILEHGRPRNSAGPAEGEIEVSIPAGFEDSTPRYLETRRRETARLRESAAAGDFERIRTMGHKLSGSGEPYGFVALTALGAALELAAETKDRDSVDRQIGQIESYLGAVRLRVKCSFEPRPAETLKVLRPVAEELNLKTAIDPQARAGSAAWPVRFG